MDDKELLGTWVDIHSCQDNNRHVGLTGLVYNITKDGSVWVILSQSKDHPEVCITADISETNIPAMDVLQAAAIIAYAHDYNWSQKV